MEELDRALEYINCASAQILDAELLEILKSLDKYILRKKVRDRLSKYFLKPFDIAYICLKPSRSLEIEKDLNSGKMNYADTYRKFLELEDAFLRNYSNNLSNLPIKYFLIRNFMIFRKSLIYMKDGQLIVVIGIRGSETHNTKLIESVKSILNEKCTNYKIKLLNLDKDSLRILNI